MPEAKQAQTQAQAQNTDQKTQPTINTELNQKFLKAIKKYVEPVREYFSTSQFNSLYRSSLNVIKRLYSRGFIKDDSPEALIDVYARNSVLAIGKVFFPEMMDILTDNLGKPGEVKEETTKKEEPEKEQPQQEIVKKEEQPKEVKNKKEVKEEPQKEEEKEESEEKPKEKAKEENSEEKSAEKSSISAQVATIGNSITTLIKKNNKIFQNIVNEIPGYNDQNRSVDIYVKGYITEKKQKSQDQVLQEAYNFIYVLREETLNKLSTQYGIEVKIEDKALSDKEKAGDFGATKESMIAVLDSIRDELIDMLNKKKFKDKESVFKLDVTAGKDSKADSPLKGMFYIEVTKRVIKEIKPKKDKGSFSDRIINFANRPGVKGFAKSKLKAP